MAALLIDTYSLFYRAFHALPPMTTRAGLPTGAIYGLSVLLLKLLREQAPCTLAFALDAPEQTFRHREHAGYKAGRAPAPSELGAQFPLLDELLDALGVPAFRAPGFEADDVLATLAHELRDGGDEVLVVSGDRDLLQLARPGVDVLFVGARGKPPRRYDAAAVVERFGVPPERLPSYVALVGDSSDNIPKVKGVGEVLAQRLIAAHPDIGSLLANLDAQPPRVQQLLREHEAQLRASESLARLRADLELAPGPRSAALSGRGVENMRGLFERLEFQSLLPRLAKLAAAG
jgi:DNA polymerase-1